MNCGVLHWSYRDFRQIPEELRTCSDQVVEVYLKENFIPSIPVWFCEEMTRLRFVCLAGNMIAEVPEQISLLQNLESLNLSQNLVEVLPKSLGKLRNLCSLKLSENRLTRLPKEIGNLENLEVLDLSKNRLIEVPIELVNCTKLKDLIFDDNYLLCRIPTKVFVMPQLMFISAERCNLVLLPFILNTTTLEGVKVFNNYTLTHYPMGLERFMQPSYDLFTAVEPKRISNTFYYQRVSCDVLPHNLIFPIELTTILDRRKSTHTPRSLVELCMRRCNLAKMIDTYRLDSCLPQSLSRKLQNGPLAICGSVPCSIDIFGECFLGLVKRRKQSRLVVFSILFCSKLCADLWFQYNCDIYDELSWALV